MGARIRPTVPHSGALPHREHRADGSRREFHRQRKDIANRLRGRLEEVREAEVKEEIDELKNAT